MPHGAYREGYIWGGIRRLRKDARGEEARREELATLRGGRIEVLGRMWGIPVESIHTGNMGIGNKPEQIGVYYAYARKNPPI
jgi:hypothetical protein